MLEEPGKASVGHDRSPGIKRGVKTFSVRVEHCISGCLWENSVTFKSECWHGRPDPDFCAVSWLYVRTGWPRAQPASTAAKTNHGHDGAIAMDASHLPRVVLHVPRTRRSSQPVRATRGLPYPHFTARLREIGELSPVPLPGSPGARL